MNTTGEKIKEILYAKRLTQGDLAKIGGTTRQNVANYVSNLSKPNWEFLANINTQLDVNLNWFIADNGCMFNATPNEALKEELRQEFEKLMKSKGL